MFLLPLPAAARLAVRHLSVKHFWGPGPAAAHMTKVRGRGSLRSRRESCPRATGTSGQVRAALFRASEPSYRHWLERNVSCLCGARRWQRAARGCRPPPPPVFSSRLVPRMRSSFSCLKVLGPELCARGNDSRSSRFLSSHSVPCPYFIILFSPRSNPGKDGARIVPTLARRMPKFGEVKCPLGSQSRPITGPGFHTKTSLPR